MVIERRIRINNRNYFLGIELKYGNGKILSKLNGNYFDMGDLTIMIDTIEKSYKKESKEMIYDKEISYMNDVIYLYDRFPFISYIKDISYSEDKSISNIGCINKKEITDYIEENNIKINRWDKSNCYCPLLYK